MVVQSNNNNNNSGASSSSSSNAFRYDRRGFDIIIQLLIFCAFVSIGIIALYDWKIGTFCFLLTCIYFITAEAISARPDNNPTTFIQWRQRNASTIANCPILLCFGDSLTHGNCSASYTPEIPLQLSLKLGLPLPTDTVNATFMEPIYVVNGGQNSITSHTVVTEKFFPYMNAVRPDYVVILIGTNDIQALCRPNFMGRFIRSINRISENPSLSKLEYNLQQMIDAIMNDDQYQFVQLAICTIPPLGENLNSKSNMFIRQANIMIEQLVNKASLSSLRITLLPLYNEFEKKIQQKKNKFSFPYDLWWILAIIMNPIYHLSYGGNIISWNLLSQIFFTNHIVLSDGVHLNERGRDIFVSIIINDFLYKKNITKAIAVKKFR